MSDRRSRSRTAPEVRVPTDVVDRVRAVLPHLSPAQSRVAAIVQADPPAAAALTVDQLATLASTSVATVVRAARSLGFEGYPQLRLALAAHGGSHPAATVPLGAQITESDTGAAVLAKLAAFESQQLRETAELIDPAALDRVVALVAAARRVDVYGISASGLVALDLMQKLTRIGLDCRAHTEHDAALVSASLLAAGDVAIGVSHGGSNPGTLKPLAAARGAGATTVAITGTRRSALGRHADHVLVTAGREFGFRSAAMASRTGQLLVVDAIFIGVAQRVPDARAALQRTYDAVSRSGRARPAGA
ncbi:MurR/RpiR family transcriptional regulator [Pengzhenrongella sicca]|uniref:MurR/RpiR family transcriptional regulator n=1 Tax=Pengzhenrongella sicca TaxID=2819238 RepID=A0A8A4ZDY8_9MICO|nr:MurR/RpiR family transcriptional regulator [Pengzhenrongella sicca]QTE30124.1 MurR/RpiR family transcriptional regulator [Pengzhenrongella sicca]